MSLAARLAAALLLCLVSHVAGAQESIKSAPVVSWGLWGGIARNSPTNLWGAQGGRDIDVVAVRMARRIRSSDRMTLELALDLVPGAWVTMPRSDSLYVARCEKPMPGEVCRLYQQVTRTERAHGFGVAPLGLQARFRPHAAVQPYVALSGGMLRFGEPIPVSNGTTLNFTADAGTGLMIALPRQTGLVVGYKFYHISNGGTGQANPGLDGHMMVVGLTRIGR